MKSVYGYEVTLKQFRVLGHRLVDGDRVLYLDGCIRLLNTESEIRILNTPDDSDAEIYIIKAAALEGINMHMVIEDNGGDWPWPYVFCEYAVMSDASIAYTIELGCDEKYISKSDFVSYIEEFEADYKEHKAKHKPAFKGDLAEAMAQSKAQNAIGYGDPANKQIVESHKKLCQFIDRHGLRGENKLAVDIAIAALAKVHNIDMRTDEQKLRDELETFVNDAQCHQVTNQIFVKALVEKFNITLKESN